MAGWGVGVWLMGVSLKATDGDALGWGMEEDKIYVLEIMHYNEVFQAPINNFPLSSTC